MEHSPADVIAYLLLDLGLGSDGGVWPVYVTTEPDSPDDLLVVSNTQGSDSGRTAVDGEVLSHYGFQVMVRCADEARGSRKAYQLRTALSKVLPTVVVCGTANRTRYLVPAVSRIGQIVHMGRGRPGDGRNRFTLNAVSAVRPL